MSEREVDVARATLDRMRACGLRPALGKTLYGFHDTVAVYDANGSSVATAERTSFTEAVRAAAERYWTYALFTSSPEPPAWRTSTVTGVVNGMRAEQDFSGMPVLADALEDAGFVDRYVLATMREAERDYADDTRLSALAGLPGGQNAVVRIEIFATAITDIDTSDHPRRPFGLAYHDLVTAAAAFVRDEDEVMDVPFHEPFCARDGSTQLQQFWDDYVYVTGARLPDHVRPADGASFFSCNCGMG